MNAKKSQTLKLAAIPVLAVVLYYVLPGSEDPPVATIGLKQPLSNQSLKNSGSLEGNRPDETEKVVWPVFSASDIASTNPFNKSMIFPELASQSSQRDESASTALLVSDQVAEQVVHRSTIKIQAIFQSNHGVAALVGTKIVHVGDRLDDGTKVIAITPEHLVIAVPGVD